MNAMNQELKQNDLVQIINPIEGDESGAIYRVIEIDSKRDYILVQWINSQFNLMPIFSYFKPNEFKKAI
jgi:ribosomal protein L24